LRYFEQNIHQTSSQLYYSSNISFRTLISFTNSYKWARTQMWRTKVKKSRKRKKAMKIKFLFTQIPQPLCSFINYFSFSLFMVFIKIFLLQPIFSKKSLILTLIVILQLFFSNFENEEIVDVVFDLSWFIVFSVYFCGLIIMITFLKIELISGLFSMLNYFWFTLRTFERFKDDIF
jgi:hypothetical protein